VVSSRTCLASSTNEPGTSTSLGPADRKSGTSKPAARWVSLGEEAARVALQLAAMSSQSGVAISEAANTPGLASGAG
jgi:hypothetical protein